MLCSFMEAGFRINITCTPWQEGPSKSRLLLSAVSTRLLPLQDLIFNPGMQYNVGNKFLCNDVGETMLKRHELVSTRRRHFTRNGDYL